MMFQIEKYLRFFSYNLGIALLFLAIGCGKGGFKTAPTLGDVAKGSNGNPVTSTTVPPNAKVFAKNPTVVAGLGYSCVAQENCSNAQPIEMSSALTSVTIEGTTGGKLQNNDMTVFATTFSGCDSNGGNCTQTNYPTATADASGNWLPNGFTTIQDYNSGNHFLGQVMAYYWINQESKAVQAAAGATGWAPAGKKISVYPRAYSATDQSAFGGMGFNAFYDPSQNGIFLSFTGPWEAAYDASVYLHEMAHANIDYQTNGQISGNNEAIACTQFAGAACCPSADGCAFAMNEGQADVHSYIVFNAPRLGEFFMDSSAGLPDRDAELNANVTAQTRFSDPNGGAEVHNFGGIWAASWWTLRKSVGPAISDKLFFSSLHMFTANDTFKTALKSILTADEQLNAGAHASQITAAFAHHGITPP